MARRAAHSQAVHSALEPAAQRLEEEGDDASGDERDQQIAFGAEERAQVAHHEHIDAHHADGQGAVDERAVNQNVDIIQTVSEDGDARRDRNAYRRQIEERSGRAVIENDQDGDHDKQEGSYPCPIGEPLELLPFVPSRSSESENHRDDTGDHGREQGQRNHSGQQVKQLRESRDADRIGDIRQAWIGLVGVGGREQSGERPDDQQPTNEPREHAPSRRRESPIWEEEQQEGKQQVQTRFQRPIRQ